MTTIAWRDGVMAADMLAVTGGIPCRCTKLFRLKDGRVVGFAGSADTWRLFLAWLQGDGEPPRFTDRDRDNFQALVMYPDGRVEEWETERIGVPVEDPFYAIGSGRDAAMGAMHMGASAEKAVEIAALCDVNTGNGWIAMRCRERE